MKAVSRIWLTPSGRLSRSGAKVCTVVVTLLATWLLTGCGGGSVGPDTPAPLPFQAQLSVSPKSLTLGVGQSVRLRAELNYAGEDDAAFPPLEWRLLEPQGGTVIPDDEGATYIAPTKAGTYRVLATRNDFRGVSATVSVVVTEQPQFVPSLELVPKSIDLMPGQTHAFSANINYPPGSNTLRQPVTWRVVEPTAGSISSSGLYSAPAGYGSYQVQATRDDYPEFSTRASIRVGYHQTLLLDPPAVMDGPEQLLMSDQTTWFAWRKAHGLAENDTIPANVVDFSRHMLASIVLPGQSACDRTSLKQVQAEAGKLVARITVKPPLPTTFCIAMPVYPNWLIVVPKSDLPLEVIVSH